MKRLSIMVLLALIVLVAFAFADGFSSFTTTNSGIASNEVSAVAVDYLGQLFIGTKDSGLSMLQGSEWTHFTTDNSGLASDRIKAVACDSSGRVFIGTDSGLSIMSSSGWQTFTTDNSDLTDNWVESLAVVPDGVVWVGTHSGGLCSYDGTTWEHFNTSNSGLASNRIASVTVGKDGAVWVGTSDAGVSVMSDDTWTTYNTGNSLLMSDNINSIGVCPSGAVWVGTPNGLCVFRNGEWENGTSLVFDADVRAIVVDEFGYRWFGLRTGIVQFDGAWAVDYDYEVSNACITSVALGASRVYFGSRAHGLLWFDYGANLPPLMPQTPAGPDTGSTDAAMEFWTVTSDPEGGSVSYQFDWDDGSDSPWGPATQSHTYASLGTYRIIVRAKDSSGKMSAYSEGHTVRVATGNRPPQSPTTPRGPESALVQESVEFSTSSYDPDGDEIEFLFDWGDGNQSDWGQPVQTWVYGKVGTFSVRAKARDDKGRESQWSFPASITIERPNSPPSRPQQPSGPSSGLVNTTYTFTTSATDPDGDQVLFLFDWGDGSDSGWGPPSASHAYKRTGAFDICALAKDVHDAQSNWSKYHTIEITGTPKPIIELGSVRETYYFGDTIKLYGTLINDLDEMTVDVYIAFLLPGSDTLLYYPNFGADPFPIRMTLAAHSEFGPYCFLQFPIASQIPRGSYYVYGALVEPGTQFEFVSEIDVLKFEYAGERQDS